MRINVRPRYVGRVLREIRERHGRTQEWVAARMGTSQATVASVERDACQPLLGVLWSIEEALGLPHGELVRLSYPESERLPQGPHPRGRPKERAREQRSTSQS